MDEIDDRVRAAFARDLDLAIRRQRGRDRQYITQEVYKIALEETIIKEKISRVPTWSGKWWHLLNQLNILRGDLIAGFSETDRFDPSISRNILLGGWAR